METLAAKSNVSSNLVFANRHKIPFDWPDTDLFSTLDPTPMAVFPSIPAEMLGVRLSRHAPASGDDDLEELPSSSTDIDWSQLTNEAAQNADLDITEHVPPPPEVIEIDDDTDYVYVLPVTPFIKQEPVVSTPTDTPESSSSPTTIPPPSTSS